MKSFLVKNKRPVLKWSQLPDGIMFKGDIPEGFKLAIVPSEGMIVIDVDNHDNSINGFNNIPLHIKHELDKTLNYATKSSGRHYWFYYTGSDVLLNSTSGLGIDIRTHKGYAIWYHNKPIELVMTEIKPTSIIINEWLSELFIRKK
jgi:hypothetical protein